MAFPARLFCGAIAGHRGMHKAKLSPMLTIGIPTWNRCEPLRENILSIVSEVEQYDGEVGVFISDNASSDETQQLCESFAKQYPFITYCRNESNLGANANFLNVLRSSPGRYVWLMGDDDMVVAGSVGKILNDIKAFGYPDVIVGGCIDDSDERVYLEHISSHVVTHGEVFRCYPAAAIGGKISVLIFAKEPLGRVVDIGWEAIQELRTGWPHLVWMILVLSQGGSLLLLPYGTNRMLERSRFNLLYDGISLAQLHINDYQRCLYRLRPYLTEEMYSDLNEALIKRRLPEIARYVLYATWLNKYGETVSYAFRTIALLRWKNRLYFGVAYVAPILVPIVIRKAIARTAYFVCRRCHRYKSFINRLVEMRRRLSSRKSAEQRSFSVEDL